MDPDVTDAQLWEELRARLVEADPVPGAVREAAYRALLRPDRLEGDPERDSDGGTVGGPTEPG